MTIEPNVPGYFYDPADEAAQDDSDRRKKWLLGDSKSTGNRRRSDPADRQGEDSGAAHDALSSVSTEVEDAAVDSDLAAENDSPEPPDGLGTGVEDPESAVIRSVLLNAEAAREAGAARQDEPSDSTWVEPSDGPGDEPEWHETHPSPADGGGPNVPDEPRNPFGRPDREDGDGSDEPDEPDKPKLSEDDADSAAHGSSDSAHSIDSQLPGADPWAPADPALTIQPDEPPPVVDDSQPEGANPWSSSEPQSGALDQNGAEPPPELQFDERQAPSLTRSDRGELPPSPEEPDTVGDKPDFFYDSKKHVPPAGSTAALILASARREAEEKLAEPSAIEDGDRSTPGENKADVEGATHNTIAETAAPVDDDPFAEFSEAIRALEADIQVEDGVDADWQPAAGAAPDPPDDAIDEFGSANADGRHAETEYGPAGEDLNGAQGFEIESDKPAAQGLQRAWELVNASEPSAPNYPEPELSAGRAGAMSSSVPDEDPLLGDLPRDWGLDAAAKPVAKKDIPVSPMYEVGAASAPSAEPGLFWQALDRVSGKARELLARFSGPAAPADPNRTEAARGAETGTAPSPSNPPRVYGLEQGAAMLRPAGGVVFGLARRAFFGLIAARRGIGARAYSIFSVLLNIVAVAAVVLLGARAIFKMVGASAEASIVSFVFESTDELAGAFIGIIPPLNFGDNSMIEFSSLFSAGIVLGALILVAGMGRGVYELVTGEDPVAVRIGGFVDDTFLVVALVGMVLLGLRLLFQFLGTSAGVPFVGMVGELSDPLMAPFGGMFSPQQISEIGVLDLSALFALAAFGIAVFVVGRLLRAGIRFAAGRHSAAG